MARHEGNGPKQKAARAADRQALQGLHVAMALKALKLSNTSQRMVSELIDLIHDHESAAAFKAKMEERLKAKSEGSAPGDPFVAGMLLDFDADMQRVSKRRQKNLERLRHDVNNLINDYADRMARHEGRT